MYDPLIDRLLDILPHPVLLCNEDGVVVQANEPALHFTGRSMEWLQDNPADSWLIGDDGFLWPPDDSVVERELRVIDGGSASGGEQRVRATIGTVPVSGGMGWLIALGDTAARLAVLQAVTRGVASELNAQIAALTRADITSLDRASSGAGDDLLREVLAAARHAAVLQGQLAQVAGGHRAGLIACSLGALVRDSASIFASVIGDDAMLRLDAPPSDEDRIKGDPDALRLALIAIAEWIAARRVAGAAPGVVEMRVDASGASSVRLVIFDSSPGLNDLERARLFDPENRAGLATLEGIIERHGGRALVDGRPDQGTHFHIEFPRPEAAPRPDRPSRELVLVIEDDDDIRELATDILELNGFEVLAAANGVEASVILRQRYRDLDAVLVDAVLPGRSGLDLIEEARSLRVALPVLLMSSYSKGFLGPRLRADIPVLSKPFGPGDLVRRVREVLDS